jgi:acyl transferase domain-containing protein
MSDALACGDPVRSIILNSAANHSGRTQGISMPGRQSQEALLARLHHEVGCDPHLTTYVEVSILVACDDVEAAGNH